MKPFQAPTLIFYGLIAFFLGVSAVCFGSALQWINRPFAGFLVYTEPYVGTYSVRDWPGPQAGLRAMDRIVAVDGVNILKGRELVEASGKKSIGDSIHLLIESKGVSRSLTLPIALFTLTDFFLIFFLTSLGGILLFALGVVVYLLKPGTLTSWVFLLLCLSLAVYMVTGFDILSSYRLWSVHLFALSLFPAFFFHLGLVFPERKRILASFSALEYLIYLPSVILCLGFQVWIATLPGGIASGLAGWAPQFKTVALLARVLSLASALTLLGCLVHAFFKASSSQPRQRARMILFGVGVAFIPTGINQAFSSYGMPSIPWNFLVFIIILFPASIAYSIVRHNLFDADTIIRRTLGYVIITAVVVGAYALVTLGLNFGIGRYQAAQSQTFPILFTIGVILVFNPLRNRIQAIVDRLFFRKEYDYGKIIDKIGAAMTSVLDQGEILKRLMKTFIEDMFINTSSILLLQPATAAYHVSMADGERAQDIGQRAFRRDKPLMQIIEREKKELTKFDVQEDPKYKEVSGECAGDFEGLHSSLMVPLVFQDQVIGLLSLGEKKSGKAFNREDVDLLRALANQSAVALENARLFQENLEKQRMEEELNIARDLQMSMLPAACPEVAGFDISALSLPAREVGGDFYDFIEMGEARVGLIIGDVTGKSVSGALVMAAARSVYRMLSEEGLKVDEIMSRANRRAKKDIRKGMFVALLYALLDGRERAVTLCSAGQTQPIHFSAKEGKASLIQTEGDTLPIGIVDEVEYKETRLELAPGDRLVFYTDGIVEAMNEKHEIFGFERLLELVRTVGSLNAQGLLKEIIDRVNAFAGTAPQSDDLTVIVISAEGTHDGPRGQVE